MRPCPRTIDRPMILLGLEPEDIAVIVVLCGLTALFFGPFIPGIAGLAGWLGLARFKKDKPPGFVLHSLYALGLELKGLLPPASKIKVYSVWNNVPNS